MHQHVILRHSVILTFALAVGDLLITTLSIFFVRLRFLLITSFDLNHFLTSMRTSFEVMILFTSSLVILLRMNLMKWTFNCRLLLLLPCELKFSISMDICKYSLYTIHVIWTGYVRWKLVSIFILIAAICTILLQSRSKRARRVDFVGMPSQLRECFSETVS